MSPGLRRRERVLLILAATAVAAVVLALVLFLPKLQDVRNARTGAQRRQAELARTAALVQQRPEIEQRYQETVRAEQSLLGRIPAGLQLPDLIVQIDRTLTLSRVDLVQLEFSEGEQKPEAGANASGGAPEGMGSLALRVQVRGSYPQLRTFVAAVETLPRIVAIDRVVMTQSEGAVLADVAMRAFYFR